MQTESTLALSGYSHRSLGYLLMVLATASLLAGCPQDDDKAAKRTPPAASDGEDAEEVDDGDDGPAKSTYAQGKSSPMAEKMCNAIQSVPRTAKATCCKNKPGALLTAECSRMLSSAIADASVKVESSAVDTCADAMKTLYTGCDWVGTRARPLPAACKNVVKGTRKATQPCRSALECEDGLYCHGVSPTSAGKCGPPRPSGGACGRGIDPLSAYVGDDGRTHPECEGVCANGKCRNVAAIDAACRSNAQCGIDAHCGEDAKCHAGYAGKRDGPCMGGRCVDDATCIGGVCKPPKPEGEVCGADSECRAACIKAEGAKTGKCGMRCTP